MDQHSFSRTNELSQSSQRTTSLIPKISKNKAKRFPPRVITPKRHIRITTKPRLSYQIQLLALTQHRKNSRVNAGSYELDIRLYTPAKTQRV